MENSSGSSLWKGYLIAAIAEITYGMNPLFAVPLYENDGMNPDSVVFFRYIMALPIIAAMVIMRGRRLAIPRYAVVPSIILGLLMALSSLTLFLSYKYMNAGIASTLLFIYPIIVALIMVIFSRKDFGAPYMLYNSLARGHRTALQGPRRSYT